MIPPSSHAVRVPRPVWPIVAIVLLGLVAHLAALKAPFLFDDELGIKENASITSLARLDDVLWPPVNGSGVSGRPLVNLSLALNYAWGGLDPTGYHLFNLLLHAWTGVLLWAVLSALFQRVAPAQLSARLSLAVALLWVVHPLQTESVAGVIQRTEILGGFFYLLTLWGFLRSLDSPRPGRWQAGAVFACLVGVTAKETVFTAPLLVLLLDRTVGAGTVREAWRRRSGFYLGLAASWLLLAWILFRMGGTRGEAAGFGAGVITWWSYFLRQWEAIVTYLKLVFWPHPLVLDYGCDVIVSPSAVVVQGMLLVTLGVVTVLGVIRRRLWALPLAAFFLILGPSSSVMPLAGQTAAEHRMYLPLAAILVLAVWGGWLMLGTRGRWVWALGVGCLVLATAARSRAYLTPLVLWRETIQLRPENTRAHYNAGLTAFDLGRLDEAVAHYEAALRVDPVYVRARVGLGEVAAARRDVAAAIRHYQAALVIDPRLFKTHNNLGNLLAETPGREQEALSHYQAALQLNPNHAATHSNLSKLLLRLPGRQAEAVAHAEQASRLEPDRREIELGLAMAFATNPSRSSEAIRILEAMVRRRPDDSEARNNLAILLAAQPDRRAEAIGHYETVVRQNPADLNSHYNLGIVLAGMPGRQADAAAHYETVLALQPDHAAAHNNLGQLLLVQPGREPAARDHFAAAVRFSPNTAIYRFNHGAALSLWPESREAARQEFATALKLDPNFTAAADALRRLSTAP